MSLCGKLPASPGSAVLINSSMTLSGNGSPEGEVLAQRGYNGGGWDSWPWIPGDATKDHRLSAGNVLPYEYPGLLSSCVGYGSGFSCLVISSF